MASDDDSEPDEETLAAFTRLLEKIGPSWLEKHKPAISSDAPKPPQTETLESFLRQALERSEKSRETLADRLEAMMAVLTPEQLTLLRSAKPTPTPSGDPAAPANPPAAEPPPKLKAKKPRWL